MHNMLHPPRKSVELFKNLPVAYGMCLIGSSRNSIYQAEPKVEIISASSIAMAGYYITSRKLFSQLPHSAFKAVLCRGPQRSSRQRPHPGRRSHRWPRGPQPWEHATTGGGFDEGKWRETLGWELRISDPARAASLDRVRLGWMGILEE